MGTHAQRRGRAALVLAAATVLLAGCGGSEPATGGANGPDKATGEPISVGFVNTDSGNVARPEITATAKAAADWVNGHGGIGGRPLKLETCATDGTPATSTKCAGELIGKKVLTVLNGNDAGLDSAQPLFKRAGLRVFGTAGTAAVTGDPANTILATPPAAAIAVTGPLHKRMGVSKGVFVLPNAGPGIKKAFDGIRTSAATSDVRLTLSLVAPANPDVTAAVNAARTTHADGLIFSFGENDCTNAIRTAKSLNWKGELIAAECTQFIKALGPQAAGVKTTPALFPLSARAAAEQYDGRLKREFDTYEAAAKAAGAQKHLESAHAAYGYSTVMTFARILKGIDGDITQESIGEAMASYKGRQVLGTAKDCTAKLMPGANCGQDIIVLETRADGTQTLVGGRPLHLGTLLDRK
ncbi:ABC transporter substrate-binding protein [Streptomyces flavofungini]|uniref:ABC transporter substrate-binding protein n=1 Tax=Streptomyces flavofungini TaxID=68200 RepID=UPI0034DEA6C8